MKTETKPKPKFPKIHAAPDSRAPALAVEAWPVDRPKPYAKNPRRNDAAVEKVAASIREFGWAQPIVVDGNGVIIIGHTRLKAAKKLGLATVPVLVRADLSPEQVAALRLADNKTAELAEWDEPLLAAELDALVGAVDMEQFGFDLSAPTGTEGQTDEDAVPEPPPEPVSRRGAVYALGRHRLMCGDSTSAEDFARLMGGAKADLVFTDPPYNVSIGDRNAAINREGKKHGQRNLGGRIETNIEGDTFASDEEAGERLWRPAFQNLADNAKDEAAIYVTMPQGGTHMMMMMMMMMRGSWQVKHELMWLKSQPTFSMGRLDYDYQHEPICYGWKKSHRFFGAGSQTKSVWQFDKPKQSKLHPTMKPVALVENAILNSSGDGEIVIDAFLGSGTTVLACEKTGRVCYGMELDPHYCDVIRKRWAEFVHGDGCDWQTLAPEVDA